MSEIDIIKCFNFPLPFAKKLENKVGPYNFKYIIITTLVQQRTNIQK